MTQQHPTSQEELRNRQIVMQITNVVLDLADITDVPTRQAINDACDDAVQGLINRHYIAKETVAAALPTFSDMPQGLNADQMDGYRQAMIAVQRALNLDSGQETKE
jgi:hypothetical protein